MDKDTGRMVVGSDEWLAAYTPDVACCWKAAAIALGSIAVILAVIVVIQAMQ